MKDGETLIEQKLVVRIVSWPSPQDYNESVQNPAYAFANSVLAATEPELNVIGLPKPASGNFASVYRLFSDEGEWAVRCFLQPMSDQQERYAALSAKLAEFDYPFLVQFEFIPEGIRVHNNWFPILKMEWVNGEPLIQYIERHLSEPDELRKMATNFQEMVITLRDAGIAHGDLQHGNIIVEKNGQLRLVDYDGCFVPSLAGKHSNELGHRNYQHPRRSASEFNEHMDTFSARLISLSLLALADKPTLWDRLQAGDECLLFRRQDLLMPEYSRAFHVLEMQSDEIRNLARSIRSCLRQNPVELAPLDQDPLIAADLPPLQAVLEVSTIDSAAKVKKSEEENSSITSKSDYKRLLLPSLKYRKDMWIYDVFLALAVCLGLINFSQWTINYCVGPVGHNYLTETLRVAWPPNQKERAQELARINAMLDSAESGMSSGEGNGSLRKEEYDSYVREARKSHALLEEQYRNMPNDLFRRAEEGRYSDHDTAERDYAWALHLSGKERRNRLSPENIAIALEYVGMRKSARGREDSGAEELLEAQKLYKMLGQNRRAAAVKRAFANAALMSKQYTRAFPAYLECLEDKYTNDHYYGSLITYAAEAAIEILTSQVSDYKNPSNLKRLWDVIGKLNESKLYNNLLSQISMKGDELIQLRKYEDAQILFEVLKDLGSRRGEQKHFEELAIRRLESVAKLQEESKRNQLPSENSYSGTSDSSYNPDKPKTRLPRPEYSSQ